MIDEDSLKSKSLEKITKEINELERYLSNTIYNSEMLQGHARLHKLYREIDRRRS